MRFLKIILVQNFCPLKIKITQFPDGFRLKFLFRMFIAAINEEEILRLIFYSKDQSRRIILYYMASTQICQNETRSIPSGRDEAISGVGMFNRVNG